MKVKVPFRVSFFGRTVLGITVISGVIKTNFSIPFSITTVFGGSTVKFFSRDQKQGRIFSDLFFCLSAWTLTVVSGIFTFLSITVFLSFFDADSIDYYLLV